VHRAVKTLKPFKISLKILVFAALVYGQRKPAGSSGIGPECMQYVQVLHADCAASSVSLCDSSMNQLHSLIYDDLHIYIYSYIQLCGSTCCPGCMAVAAYVPPCAPCAGQYAGKKATDRGGGRTANTIIEFWPFSTFNIVMAIITVTQQFFLHKSV